MEQDNSLRNDLKQLVNIQQQQINLLSQMNQNQSMHNMQNSQQNMNYMPNNNSGMYAMASTNYYPNQSISNDAMARQQQFQNFASTLGTPQNKYGFFESMFPAGTRTSESARTLMSMDYGSRLGQTAVAGVGALASTAVSFGAGALLPGMTGIGASIFGGAAAGLYADVSIKEMKKQSAYEKYLFKNSYRFINSEESINDRAINGFSVNQSKEAATFLRNFSTKSFLKDEEMMKLTQNFTEGGLLKEVKDLETFKEKIGSLTKAVKSGALMLNETYDSIAELMSGLKKAGIDQKNFGYLMGAGNVLGGLSGNNAGDIVRNMINFVTGTNSGTGNSNQQLTDRVIDTQTYMTSLFNSLEDKKNRTQKEELTYNTIKNMGGSEKASQFIQGTMESMMDGAQFQNQAMYFFDYDKGGKEFRFNKGRFDQYLSSGMSLTDVMDKVTRQKQQLEESGNGAALIHWNDFASTYIKNNLTDGDMSKFTTTVLNSYLKDPKMREANMGQKEIMSMLGVKDSTTQNLLSTFLNYKDYKGDGFGTAMRLQSYWTNQNADVRSEMPSLGEAVSSWWGGIKKSITKPAVYLGDRVTEGFLKLTDQWYNYNDRKPLRYDEFFKIRSNDMESMSLANVQNQINNSNELIASSMDSLNSLIAKGYSIDPSLERDIKNKYMSANKTVKYNRDIITDWDSVNEDLRKSKSDITSLASNNDLSETIVAALMKYNNSSSSDKIKKSDLDRMIQQLGKENFAYGGNSELALAATIGGRDKIDAALKGLGYNIDGLRSVGAQDTLRNVSVSGLNLDKAIVDKVNSILGQQIGVSPTGGTKLSVDDIYKKDLREKSNVTAEDLNKIIEAKAGKDSMFYGQGQAFINASNASGLDAMYLLMHSANESSWGKSNIARSKNNFFGWGAYDSDPYNGAKTFSSVEEGLTEVATKISQQYVNSDKHKQSSLDKFNNDPLGWHNYSTSSGQFQEVAKMIKDGLDMIGKGYGTENPTSTSGVATKNKGVSKDANGNNILDSANENIFSFKRIEDNEVAVRQREFLNKVNTSTMSVQDIEKERQEAIKSVYKNTPWYAKSGDAVSSFHTYNSDVQDYMKTGKYSSVDELLSGNSKLRSQRADVLKLLGGSSEISSYLDKIDTLETIKNQNGQRYSNSTILRNFGEMAGISIEDYGGDITSYNKDIRGAARKFYANNAKNLNYFLSGVNNTEAQNWGALDTTQKLSTLEIMQTLEKVLGDTLDKSYNLSGVSKNQVITSAEKDEMKYLHYKKDSTGKKTNEIYYDETIESEDGIGIDGFEKWIAGGGKKRSTGALMKKAKSLGMDTSKDSLDDIILRTQEQKSKLTEENMKNIERIEQIASELSAGKSQMFSTLSSSQQRSLSEAMSKGDSKALQNISNTLLAQSSGMSNADRDKLGADISTINGLIKLTDSIKGIDSSGLNSIISGVEKLQNLAKDVGNTANFVQGGFMGNVYKGELNDAVSSFAKEIFEGNKEIMKNFGDLTTDSFIKALSSGGTLQLKDGTEVKLSADEITRLTESMAGAMETAMKSSLEDNETVQLIQSNKELMNKLGEKSFGGKNAVEVLDQLQSLNETLGEGSKATKEAKDKASKQREEILGEIVPRFQEAVNEIGKSMNDGSGTLEQSGKSLESTFAKYDSSINQVITTMESRLNKGWGRDVNVQPSNHVSQSVMRGGKNKQYGISQSSF